MLAMITMNKNTEVKWKKHLSNNRFVTFLYTKFHERLKYTTSLKDILKSFLRINMRVKRFIVFH